MGLVRSTSRSRGPRRIAELFFYCTTLIFSPEGVSTSHLRNVGSYLPVNMASHFRGLDFPHSPRQRWSSLYSRPRKPTGGVQV